MIINERIIFLSIFFEWILKHVWGSNVWFLDQLSIDQPLPKLSYIIKLFLLLNSRNLSIFHIYVFIQNDTKMTWGKTITI
jgi:hypothetical protein